MQSDAREGVPAAPVVFRKEVARRFRLLILLPGFEVGGTEKAICRLVCGLNPSMFATEVAVFRPGGACQTLLPGYVPVHVLGPHKDWRRLRTIVRLGRLVESQGIDLVYSVLNGANLVALVARLTGMIRVPVVIGVRSDYRYGLRRGVPWSRVKKWLVRFLYPRADRILCVTEESRAVLVSEFDVPRAMTGTLGNVIPTLPEVEAANEDAGIARWIESGPPVLLSVGRLDPVKRFDTLLEVFRRVRAQRDARLLILGEGPERDRLARLIREMALSDYCWLAGVVLEPMRHMRRASCLVVTSKSEGFPNVVAEAAMCGLPVVGFSGAASVAEIVHAMGAGRVVSDGHIGAMAEAIVEVLDNAAVGGNHTGVLAGANDRQFGEVPAAYEREFLSVLAEKAQGNRPIVVTRGTS